MGGENRRQFLQKAIGSAVAITALPVVADAGEPTCDCEIGLPDTLTVSIVGEPEFGKYVRYVGNGQYVGKYVACQDIEPGDFVYLK